MRTVLFSAMLVVALGFSTVGCGGGGEKKSEPAKPAAGASTTPAASGGSTTPAAKSPCTKCACPDWTDPNGDGKCDGMVGDPPKACDHAKADHKSS